MGMWTKATREAPQPCHPLTLVVGDRAVVGAPRRRVGQFAELELFVEELLLAEEVLLAEELLLESLDEPEEGEPVDGAEEDDEDAAVELEDDPRESVR